MDWLNLPSLNSLRAFSVLAETGSYTKAAKRLNVTYPAVSQQVKMLEEYLDISLIVREGRSVRLTEAGGALSLDLEIAFTTISRAVTNVLQNEISRPVQITTSPAFAVEWLLPRMTEFQQLYPNIMLMLNPTVDVVPLLPGGVDLAVRYCDNDHLKLGAPTILVTDMVIIGSPALIRKHRFNRQSDLGHFPWLQELGTNEAISWFKRNEIRLETPLKITQMPGNLIMEAVRRGDGITYTARAFFENDIDNGRVNVLHSEPSFGVYFLEINPNSLRPAVRTFIDWLMSHAEIVRDRNTHTNEYPSNYQPNRNNISI